MYNVRIKLAYLLSIKNEGEIDYFDVRVVGNDDNSVETVWSLLNPSLEEGWIIGRVEITPYGEKEYKVIYAL